MAGTGAPFQAEVQYGSAAIQRRRNRRNHDNWTPQELSTNAIAIGSCLVYRSFQTWFDRTLMPILQHEFPAS